jgi:hypothetical protein
LKVVPFSHFSNFEIPQPKCLCCPCFSSVGNGRECKGGVSRMKEVDGLVGGKALGRLEGVGRNSPKKLVSRVAKK